MNRETNDKEKTTNRQPLGAIINALTMRETILTIFFGLLFTFSHGQTINVRIGPTFSKLSWDNSISDNQVFNKSIVGVDALLGIDYLNFKYFNLSSNFGYIQKGGSGTILVTTIQNPEEEATIDVKTLLHFITANTIFEAKVPIIKFITPFIHAGPRLDYLLSYKEDVNMLKGFEDLNKLNKFIYGLIVGGGIDFKISKIKLGVTFDFYWNFNRLVDYISSSGFKNQIYDKTFTLNAQIDYNF